MLEELIRQKNIVVIDVRTQEEFEKGHVENSKNIPLQEIPEKIEEISNLPEPLILCCAVGVRSEYACQYLRESGIECYNGGSWRNVKSLQKAPIKQNK